MQVFLAILCLVFVCLYSVMNESSRYLCPNCSLVFIKNMNMSRYIHKIYNLHYKSVLKCWQLFNFLR